MNGGLSKFLTILALGSLTVHSLALATPAKKPTASAKPAAAASNDVIRCAAAATLNGAIGSIGNEKYNAITDWPKYPKHYGLQTIISAIDRDKSLQTIESRAFIMTRIWGGRARSKVVDTVRYQISHIEGEFGPSWLEDPTKLRAVIEQCTAKGLDKAIGPIDQFSHVESDKLAAAGQDTVFKEDYEGVNYNEMCGPSSGRRTQTNDYVAGLPNDYCERMRPGSPIAPLATAATGLGAGWFLAGAVSKPQGKAAPPTTQTPSPATPADPNPSSLSCAQIATQLRNDNPAPSPGGFLGMATSAANSDLGKALGKHFGGALGGIFGSSAPEPDPAAQQRRDQLLTLRAQKNCP